MKISDEIRTALVLMIICVVSGVLLALVYGSTNGVISANKDAELESALSKVMPYECSFDKIETELGENTEALYSCSSDGNVLGYVLLAYKTGFQSTIRTLIGIDSSTDKITGLLILEHLETPGLGSRIEDESFTSGFAGQAASSVTVDSITGATISSDAVIAMVKASIMQSGDAIGVTIADHDGEAAAKQADAVTGSGTETDK